MTHRIFTRLYSLKKSPWAEQYFVGILVFMAIVGMAISLVIGMQQSVWFDEGYSIMLAQRPVGELISLTAVDAHPPLYYLLLKAWMAVFGTSELALRISSVLCGGLAIVGAGFLIKELFSKRVALMALPFLVFAPFLLRYDYEIRMYAFVTLIGVTSTWVLVRAWQTKRVKWWILYGALVAAGMYTLYMSAVFWLAHIAWLLFMTRQQKERITRQPFWLAYAGAAIVFLPWAPTVLSQLKSSALPPYMDSVTIYQLTNILGQVMAYRPGWQIGAWLSVLLVLFVGLFIYVGVKVWQRATKAQRAGLLMLGMCFVVGIGFYALISMPPNPPRFLERYVVHISIFWYALLGVVIALGWQLRLKRSVALLAAVSVAVMTLGIVTLVRIGNYNFQRLQYLQAETIREDIGCRDTTYVTAGPYGYIDMAYELQGCQLKFYYPHHVTFSGGFAPVNGSKDEIRDSSGIATKRIVYVYYDDSDVYFTPDGRFHEVERRSFDKTRIIIYEQ